MFNFSGNSLPLNAANRLSLHHSNPGISSEPAADTELTDAPYERKSCVFAAPVADVTAAVCALQATVQFQLNLNVDQQVAFVGLWSDNIYLGNLPLDEVAIYTGTSTNRRFDVLANVTLLKRDNPQNVDPE